MLNKETRVHYTCDRHGCQSNGTIEGGTGAASLPEGWAYLQMASPMPGRSGLTRVALLCPACREVILAQVNHTKSRTAQENQ